MSVWNSRRCEFFWSISNDENGEKQLVLQTKQQLCTCITLFSTFLWRSWSLHDYGVYGERTWTYNYDEFSSLFLNLHEVQNLNHDLGNLNKWLISNKLTLNTAKNWIYANWIKTKIEYSFYLPREGRRRGGYSTNIWVKVWEFEILTPLRTKKFENT